MAREVCMRILVSMRVSWRSLEVNWYCRRAFSSFLFYRARAFVDPSRPRRGLSRAAAVLADLDDLHRVGAAGLPDGLADGEHDEVPGIHHAVGEEHRFGLAEKL